MNARNTIVMISNDFTLQNATRSDCKALGHHHPPFEAALRAMEVSCNCGVCKPKPHSCPSSVGFHKAPVERRIRVNSPNMALVFGDKNPKSTTDSSTTIGSPFEPITTVSVIIK